MNLFCFTKLKSQVIDVVIYELKNCLLRISLNFLNKIYTFFGSARSERRFTNQINNNKPVSFPIQWERDAMCPRKALFALPYGKSSIWNWTKRNSFQKQ